MKCKYVVPVRINEKIKRSAYEAYIANVQAFSKKYGMVVKLETDAVQRFFGAARPEWNIVMTFQDTKSLRQFLLSKEYRYRLNRESRTFLKHAYLLREDTTMHSGDATRFSGFSDPTFPPTPAAGR